MNIRPPPPINVLVTALITTPIKMINLFQAMLDAVFYKLCGHVNKVNKLV